MVFDVAPPLVVLVVQVGELAKYLSGTLSDDVGEDVQAPPMRHSDHDVPDTIVAGPFDEQVQQGNQGLATL